VNLPRLRAALKYGNVEWERHVLERLVSRDISRSTVLNILRSGECIEDYPDEYPFPSGLFFGWHGAKPLRIVAALEEPIPRVYFITAYEPDLEHFENDFRARRKK
jgi:Domain of unknown function (DUF4258)